MKLSSSAKKLWEMVCVRAWTGYSDKDMYEAEKYLLFTHEGLNPSRTKLRQTLVSDDPNDTIHSITVANKTGIPLVLLPGYGATAAMYYRFIKDFSKNYEVHCVDFRGMGCSGRSPFTAASRTEAEYYLLQGLTKWLNTNNLGKFVLCGHSLGGYIATKYAYINPERVLALALISPAGVWKQPKGFNPMTNCWREVKETGYIGKKAFSLILNHWKPGSEPFELCRILGRATHMFLSLYIKTYPQLSPEERKYLEKLIFYIHAGVISGDRCMPYILQHGGFGYDPLVSYLPQLKMYTTITFGEYDWVRLSTAENLEMYNPRIRQRIIKGSTHTPNFDAPKLLYDYISTDLNEYLKRYSVI